MENLSIYAKARGVPQEALKPITAGRLKGMSDINPMWRIKKLTEIFGPCGVGWWYEITNQRIEYDELTKQKAAFVDIMLYYVDPESGTISHGIPGVGGSSFVAQEKSGPYMSDECFKMALTDSISVAAKALGIGADVYWNKDLTKYSKATEKAENEQKTDNNSESAPMEIICPVCGKPVKPTKDKKGTERSAADVYDALGMCYECYRYQGSMK